MAATRLKRKSWFRKHPVITTIICIFLLFMVAGIIETIVNPSGSQQAGTGTQQEQGSHLSQILKVGEQEGNSETSTETKTDTDETTQQITTNDLVSFEKGFEAQQLKLLGNRKELTCKEILFAVTKDCFYKEATSEEKERCRYQIMGEWTDSGLPMYFYDAYSFLRDQVNVLQRGLLEQNCRYYADITYFQCDKGILNGAKFICDPATLKLTMVQVPVEWVIETKDPEKCKNLILEDSRNYCYYQIALELRDTSICDMSTASNDSGLYKDKCKQKITEVE